MQPATLIDLLRQRAAEAPDRTAYTYLVDGEEQEERLTYGELDRAARAIGAHLAARTRESEEAGGRALLLYPPGLDYVRGFFGCLYAGLVAVPLFPPGSERDRHRIVAVLDDSRPTLALGPRALLSGLGAPGAGSDGGTGVLRVTAEEAAGGSPESWSPPTVAGDALALLQYTSGSTASPRGVRLTHHNVLTNQAMISAGFAHTTETIFVGWLPLYHDMGLIGNLLQPLYLGVPCILLSPLDFLARPVRWLAAISRYRGTTSGGPDSAFERCVRKISPAERRGLDLSSWRVAFNGSEPVRAQTLERFTAAFAPCGFRRETFYPCYGLAEGTLIVTGGRASEPPVIQAVDESALERGQAVVAPPGPGTRPSRQLVNSGRALGGQRLEIVDADPDGTARPCPPGQVGEIWLSGPSIAAGYWRCPEDDQTFGARLATRFEEGEEGEETFLRSGDLGFLLDGELFVTGRRKDLIIVQGRNLYPQDIERTVEDCDPAIRRGCVAAFPVELAGEERVGVACEVDPRRTPDPEPLLAAVCRAVAANHGTTPALVALLAPRELPKTSSGKVKRRFCQAAIGDGTLPTLALFRDGEPAPAPLPPLDNAGEVASFLAAHLTARARLDGAALDPERPLTEQGLSSIGLADLLAALEERFALRLPAASLATSPSLAGLARAVEAVERPAPTRREAEPSPTVDPAELADLATQPFLPAVESAWLAPLLRPGVWYLFRRHFHAVWLDRGYRPAGRDTRTLYFLNHSSWWDLSIPLLLNELVFRQRARFMMSHDLMSRRSFFGALARRAGVFSVRLDDPASRAAALRYAAGLLGRAGTALYLYPQGKTLPDSAEIRFEDGVGWLHQRCPEVDFVPVACHLHTLRTARPQLYLKIGPPVSLPGAIGPIGGPTVAERARLLAGQCRDLLASLRQVADDPVRSSPPPGFTRLL